MKKSRSRGISSKDAASPLRVVVFAAVILLVILLFVGYIWRTLSGSDYFRIRHIIVKQGIPVNLNYLEGRNIFSVDLAGQSRYVLQFYPAYKAIRLTRVLPDRIYVDIQRRNALAAVKLYKYFAVDEDGLLFNLDEPSQALLPMITGLETKIFGPKAGKVYTIKELYLALQVIKEFRKSRVLRNYVIKKIDASSPANLSVVVIMPQLIDNTKVGPRPPLAAEQYIEVKFGGANIASKAGLLENILSQERKELAAIKYIDLRFANPVIKFNDAKK